MRLAPCCALLLLLPTLALASPAPPSPSQAVPSLNDSQRAALRYRLENLWNEVDLIIRNGKSELVDLGRQQRNFEMFAVFERIPMTEGLGALKSELAETAGKRGLKLLSLRKTGATPPPAGIPRSIVTDARPPFRLTPEKIAQEIRLEVTVRGDEAALRSWISGWEEEVMRVIELDERPGSISVVATDPKRNSWTVRARAWRFHPIRFPQLKPRDPREVLPSWARRAPEAFARKEPLLWSFVTRIEKSRDRAAEPYRRRGEFLLNNARMEFFLSKTLKSGQPLRARE